MISFLHGLGWVAGFAVLAVLGGWLGLRAGQHAVRKYPAAASALWMLSMFLRIAPPQPPRAERVIKDEDAAGDPPKV